MNENKSTLRHVTGNLLETNNENKILIAVKAKGHITYRRITEIVVGSLLKKKKKKRPTTNVSQKTVGWYF